jgi:hypothetical protein
MRVRLATALSGVLLGGAVSLGIAAPALAAPCDAYSQTCPSTPPGTIGGAGTGGGTAPSTAPSSVPGTPCACVETAPGAALPFTGAELVLFTLVGGAAIAGGTVFVVAGRRRRVDAA